MQKNSLPAVHLALIGILLVLIGITVYSGLTTTSLLVPQEVKKPKVAIISISADCRECIDIKEVVEALKKGIDADITEKTLSFAEAKETIAKYEIKKLPAVVVEGEVKIDALAQKANASVFETPPPYFDVESGKVKGIVDVTILNNDCLECTSMAEVVAQLRQGGLVFKEITSINSTSDEGKNIVQQFGITRLPSLLLSDDASEYDIIKQVWEQIGTREQGKLVLRKTPPPFVENNKLRGIVMMTIINDDTCTECYNASLHQNLLETNFGMKFKSVEAVDANSQKGKKLVQKYGIKQIPTYVLDNEASVYEGMAQIWEQVGTIDEGSFVFRAVDKLGVAFKDLANNTIINSQ